MTNPNNKKNQPNKDKMGMQDPSAFGAMPARNGDTFKVHCTQTERCATAAEIQEWEEYMKQEMYPIDQLLKELEAIHREETRNREQGKR